MCVATPGRSRCHGAPGIALSQAAVLRLLAGDLSGSEQASFWNAAPPTSWPGSDWKLGGAQPMLRKPYGCRTLIFHVVYGTIRA